MGEYTETSFDVIVTIQTNVASLATCKLKMVVASGKVPVYPEVSFLLRNGGVY